MQCKELETGSKAPGCSDDNGSDKSCRNGDQLWIKDCNGWDRGKGNAEFNLLQDKEFDMLRVDSTDLCMTRATSRAVNIGTCDVSDKKQWWRKISIDQPFALRPPGENDRSDNQGSCLSQHVSFP
jgi:hypothetical protein